MVTKNADTIMTILGMSGSGKTCYLLGMFYKMTGGLKGYNLHTDDDTHTDLSRRYDILNDSKKGIAEAFDLLGNTVVIPVMKSVISRVAHVYDDEKKDVY